VVEQILQGIDMACIERGAHRVGPRRFLAEAGESFGVEGMNRVADGATGTGKVMGDLRGPQAMGAGQENLGPADGEGLSGA
jgi:hypothetical protein